MNAPIFSRTLIPAIRAQYQLNWDGIHGVRHWARVLENGLRLARDTGVRTEVVSRFAVFHDACRHNDNHDPDHGARGAALALQWRGIHFELDDAGFKLLAEACRHHTSGRLRADLTVQTCWDADRLDLLRVGITPEPKRLCTAAARQITTMVWANARAEMDAFPFADLFADSPRANVPGRPRQ